MIMLQNGLVLLNLDNLKYKYNALYPFLVTLAETTRNIVTFRYISFKSKRVYTFTDLKDRTEYKEYSIWRNISRVLMLKKFTALTFYLRLTPFQ